MGRPATGTSGLGRSERMRLPCPAAKMMMADSVVIAMVLDDVAVGERALAQATRLGLTIDGEEAEVHLPALRPLEVVHERPVVVAADVDAVLDGLAHGVDVALDPQCSAIIAIISDAVLRHDDRNPERLEANQRPIEALGVQRIRHVCEQLAWSCVRLKRWLRLHEQREDQV